MHRVDAAATARSDALDEAFRSHQPWLGGPPFDNYYSRGWRAGTESVQATLTFTVEWFEPGAMLRVTAIHVD